ncbi:MAG: phosphoglucosamine mutase, partial [Rhodospirillales bacterium]|nr:phosphoglucosamine mutase [Rhodospirillales bacterium]
IGGEQSGHIVLGDYGSTGDGLVAALQVLAVVLKDGRPASFSCRPFIPLPQLLRNVRYNGGQPLEDEGVKKSIATAEQKLSGTGRLLIRKSGTEPLIRIMAEGKDENLISAVVGDIVSAVERAAG